MVGLDERPATVSFFSEIAAGHTVRPCVVDLVPIMGAGVRGLCLGDGKAWRILAHDTLPARRLFHTLLHELGHIARGDVRDSDADTYRRIMKAITEHGAEFCEGFRHLQHEHGHTDAEIRIEAEVDAWADELEAEHWPALRRRLDEQYREYIRGGSLAWQRVGLKG